MAEITVRLYVENEEDFRQLVMAVQLLRYAGVTYGFEEWVEHADRAGEALQNITVETTGTRFN